MERRRRQLHNVRQNYSYRLYATTRQNTHAWARTRHNTWSDTFKYGSINQSIFIQPSCTVGRTKILFNVFASVTSRGVHRNAMEISTGWAKKVSYCTISISSLNINQFSQFFICRFRKKFATQTWHAQHTYMSLHYLVKYKYPKRTISRDCSEIEW